MYNSLPPSPERREPFPMWFWITGIIMVLVITGLSTGAYSQENRVNTPTNASSNTQDKIAWMSGGIGSEARDEMRRAAGDYNVHLMFSGHQGHYLASIPYTVQHQGMEIHSGVADGPLLYLKLPPGSYVISAELDGERQQKRITVVPGGRSSKAAFMTRKE
jgi:hypothetical protein